MSRVLLKLSVAAAVLGALVIASSMARPGIGVPVAESANVMKVDFDQVFADVSAADAASFTDQDREKLRELGLERINGVRLGQ